MSKDIIYKLREIKYHRLVSQITNDITNFNFYFNDETIEEYLKIKYPYVDVTMKYQKEQVYNICVTIPKPVYFIKVKVTIDKKGNLINNE